MPRPKSDIDLRIVHAARDRFLHDGVDGASLRRIARAARTNIGMVYYYFPTKDDLFLAVVEEVYAQLLGDLATALAPDAPIETRLRRLFDRFAAMNEDEFKVIRLVLREAMVSSRRRARLVERFFRGHVPLVLSTLGEGIAAGRVESGHPVPLLAIATLVLAAMPQVGQRLLREQLPAGFPLPDANRIAETMCQILLRGISAPAQGKMAS
ncbi:MAG TPA: TetR/AcrR family transcriptional regulator [Polyangia bacterium]|nr:TetR/AcrR family transcriptional regulator [Polyangia bacterium]